MLPLQAETAPNEWAKWFRTVPLPARTIELIDPSLRTIIRSLVSGVLPWPLFLHGPVGTGKTCAALCLLDRAKGIYQTVGQLCDQVNLARSGRLESPTIEGRGGLVFPERLWVIVSRAPLMVLDELGLRSSVSDAHYEAVKECVDHRLGKPFVVISNLPLAEITRIYDDRIFSRLASGTVFELGGPDRRLT